MSSFSLRKTLEDAIRKRRSPVPEWYVDEIDGKWTCNGCGSAFGDKSDWMKHAQGQRSSWGLASCPYSYESKERKENHKTIMKMVCETKRAAKFARFHKEFAGISRKDREALKKVREDREAVIEIMRNSRMGKKRRRKSGARQIIEDSDSDFE